MAAQDPEIVRKQFKDMQNLHKHPEEPNVLKKEERQSMTDYALEKIKDIKAEARSLLHPSSTQKPADIDNLEYSEVYTPKNTVFVKQNPLFDERRIKEGNPFDELENFQNKQKILEDIVSKLPAPKTADNFSFADIHQQSEEIPMTENPLRRLKSS